MLESPDAESVPDMQTISKQVPSTLNLPSFNGDTRAQSRFRANSQHTDDENESVAQLQY